jgi:single-strand DNA-binding protein
VYLEGALQTRKWTDKEGAERYSTEVVLQRFRGELVMLDSRGEGGTRERVAASDAPASFQRDEMEDEIPF